VRALITGAAGFVGGHLAAHLREAGDEVTGLDRSGPDPVDVTDPDAVLDAVRRAAPDVVYHLAAVSHVARAARDPSLDAVNVGGTRSVVDACRRVGVSRVVVVGSAEEYGAVPPDRVPIREDTPLAPLTAYGRSKAQAEAVALAAHTEHGVPVVAVRAFNHTGPGQSPTFLVPGLAARIVAAERGSDTDIVVGNLAPVRDWSDVRDVVAAYHLLARDGRPGEVYNVCSGRGRSVREIAEHLVAAARRPLALRVDAALVRPVDIPVLVGDPARLVAATGWAPAHDFDATLGELLAAARATQA